MRIGMVLNNPFPPDIRVEKEVRSLVASGHHVALLACARPGEQLGLEAAADGFDVFRVPHPRSEPSMQRRWRHVRFQLTFHHRYWRDRVEEFARDMGLDVLHVHDLPLVGTAVTVARRLGIPVVADLHENYPATMEIRRAHTPRLRDRLLISSARWYAYERSVVQEADHVIVVVDEARDRLIRMHGLTGDRVSVVMNTEDPAWTPTETPQATGGNGHGADRFTVAYVGGGGPHRGLDTAVRAMEHLEAASEAIRLRIVGIRETQSDALRALAASCGVADRVEIVGWRPFEEVPHEIAAASVCLVPHHRSPHTDSTIPHKLFQYMLLGRPVIVSDCRPLVRIVEASGAGLVFRSGDPRELAERIRTLYEHDDLRAEAARRGRAAALERYNWEIDGARLCEVYDRITLGAGAAGPLYNAR